jgi:REP element-mobilizing transposase RayT
MTYDPERHHRRSIRLRGYDYRQAGAYFVTICVQDRACLFGEVVDGDMRLSKAGENVQAVWNDLPRRFPGIDLDAFVVMPNHVHGIVFLGADPDVGGDNGTPRRDEGAIHRAPTNVSRLPRAGRVEDAGSGMPGGKRHVGARFIAPSSPAPTSRIPASPPDGRLNPTLGEIVRAFKAVTTRQIRLATTHPFSWQRNYYERIVRNDRELERARAYIAVNPGRWAEDAENPSAPRP